MRRSTEANQICVFCYKIINSVENEGYNFNRFTKFLERFTHHQQTHLHDMSLMWQGCCELCRVTIDAFCEDFVKLKCLEMKMNWKLRILLEKMNFAGRVPSRWFKLQQMFERETLNNLKSYRSKIITRCKRQISNSQPNVIVNRVDGKLEYISTQEQIPEQISEIYATDPDTFHKIKIEQEEQDPLSNPGSPLAQDFIDDTVEIGESFVTKIKQENGTIENSPKLSGQKQPSKWQCNICGKKFTSRRMLTEHFKCLHLKVTRDIPCKFCTKMFPTKRRLEIHVHTVHVAATHQCPICKKSFKTRQAFNTHKLSHEDPSTWKYKCDLCGKRFSVNYQLRIHTIKQHGGIKVIAGEKCGEKYKCLECGKLWNHVSKLVRHKLTHEKDSLELPVENSVELRQQSIL